MPYATLRAQAAEVHAQALVARRSQRETLAAYVALGQSPWGQVLLDDWVQGVLLRPSLTPEDEGERRFVLKLLTTIREAPALLAALEEDDG